MSSSVAQERPNAKRNRSNEERMAVYQYLLSASNSGCLKKGSVSAVADKFGYSTRSISKIWKRGRASIAAGSVVADVSSSMTDRVGRKKKDVDLERMKEIP